MRSRGNIRKGFSILELLVVCAIIGILASIVLISVSSAREKGKVTGALLQVEQLERAIKQYADDTHKFPGICRNDCVASQDALSNSLGVVGWHGPYLGTNDAKLADPWGGQIGYGCYMSGPPAVPPALSNRYYNTDLEHDSNTHWCYIFLDDDRPGTGDTDNQGLVSATGMQAIDKALDDGNLATGRVRGNGGEPNSAASGSGLGTGEMAVEFDVIY